MNTVFVLAWDYGMGQDRNESPIAVYGSLEIAEKARLSVKDGREMTVLELPFNAENPFVEVE